MRDVKENCEKKWLCKILGARSPQKVRLPPIEAGEFELCVALIMQKYDWLILGALTTCCQHLRYV